MALVWWHQAIAWLMFTKIYGDIIKIVVPEAGIKGRYK